MERLLRLALLLTAAARLRASDPESLLCTMGAFRCLDSGSVPLCLRCDGKPDCGDGSDEGGCQAGNVSCGDRGRQCGPGGPCMPWERFCDGHSDCPDGSDESVEVCKHQVASPSPPCPEGEFRCEATQCYPLAFVCDGHMDCGDGRDELGCGSASPQPSMVPQMPWKGCAADPEALLPKLPKGLVAIVTLLALLSMAVAAVWVAVWGHARIKHGKAEYHLASFDLDKPSEQLMTQERP